MYKVVLSSCTSEFNSLILLRRPVPPHQIISMQGWEGRGHYSFVALEWSRVSLILNFMIKVVWEGCFCHVSVSAPVDKLRNHNQWGDGKITLLPMINKCLPSPWLWLINIILEVKTVVTICQDKHRELRRIVFINPEFVSHFPRNGGRRKWLICCPSKVSF